jgi:hypothetical protein
MDSMLHGELRAGSLGLAGSSCTRESVMNDSRQTELLLNVSYPAGGMVWYGAPPTSWAAIGTIRWWHLDRAPAELCCILPVNGCLAKPSAQTQSVPSALVRRWVSFPQAPAAAELRACAISLCLERRPPSRQQPAQQDAALPTAPLYSKLLVADASIIQCC